MRLAVPIIGLAISAIAHGCRGAPRIVSTETPVLELDAAMLLTRLTISPDGRKVAHIAFREGKWFVGVQGVEGKGYEELMRVPVFSGDSGASPSESGRRGGSSWWWTAWKVLLSRGSRPAA